MWLHSFLELWITSLALSYCINPFQQSLMLTQRFRILVTVFPQYSVIISESFLIEKVTSMVWSVRTTKCFIALNVPSKSEYVWKCKQHSWNDGTISQVLLSSAVRTWSVASQFITSGSAMNPSKSTAALHKINGGISCVIILQCGPIIAKSFIVKI